MKIKDILNSQGKSMYWLSKKTGLAYSTINDICNEKIDVKDCSLGNVEKITNALDVPITILLESKTDSDFELFKSEVCHELKRKGDTQFLLDVLKSNRIYQYYKQCQNMECLYLLGMVDYVSRVNGIPLVTDYDSLRKCKLPEVIYPRSILMEVEITKNEELKKEAYENSIPEFKRFNIVENEVRDVL